jgi:hypothetical protein
MEPIVGDEVLSHRHIATSKSLQPLLALVSYETDEEPYRAFQKNRINQSEILRLAKFLYLQSYPNIS